jgi:hypothetical protein
MGSMQQIMMGLTCLAAAFVFGRYVNNKPAPESPMKAVVATADSNGFLPLTSSMSANSPSTAHPHSTITSFAELDEPNEIPNRQAAKFPPAPKLPTANELQNSFNPDSVAGNENGHSQEFSSPEEFSSSNQLVAGEQADTSVETQGRIPAQGIPPTQLVRQPVVPNFSELASRFDNGPLALPTIGDQRDHSNDGNPIHEAERVPRLLTSIDTSAPQLEFRRPDSFAPKQFPRQETSMKMSGPSAQSRVAQPNPNIGNMHPINQFAEAVDQFEQSIENPATTDRQENPSVNQAPPSGQHAYKNVQNFPRNNSRSGLRNEQRNNQRSVSQSVRNTGQKFVPGVDIESYFAQRTAIEMYDKSNAVESEFGANYLNQNANEFATSSSFDDVQMQKLRDQNVRENTARGLNNNQTQRMHDQQDQHSPVVDVSRLKQWRMSTDHAPPEPDFEPPERVSPTNSNVANRAFSNPQNQHPIAGNRFDNRQGIDGSRRPRSIVGSPPEYAAPPVPLRNSEPQRMATSNRQFVNRNQQQGTNRAQEANRPIAIANRPNQSATGNIQSYNRSLVFKPFRNQGRRFQTSESEPSNWTAADSMNESNRPSPDLSGSNRSNSQSGMTQVTRPNSLRKNSNALGDEEKIYRTKPGDTLQSIAAHQLGMPDYYLAIYLANRDQLENPAFVPVDIDLVIPNIN